MTALPKKVLFNKDNYRNPKVSVVVPLFRHEEHLSEMLSSLANQTLDEIEFVFVNGGANMSSLEIVRQFRDDKRLMLIDNISDEDPVNAGFKAARGEYVGLMRPCDFVSPNAFENLYRAAKNSEADIVLPDFCIFNMLDDGSIKKERMRISQDRSWYNRDIHPLKEKEVFGFPVSAWGGIYRKDFLEKNSIQFHETAAPVYHDSCFMIMAISKAEKLRFALGNNYMMRKDSPEDCMIGINEAAAIAEGYNLIRKRIENESEILQVIDRIYYEKKLADYIECYYRIDADSKRSQLHLIKDDFAEPLRLGKLDPENVNTWILEEIVMSPDAFYDRIRVSVIMPVYNAEKYISQCLESFLSLDEIRIEVICVDDGSTDRTLEILREYEEKDYRVRVITQKNAGAGAARNNGMQYAKGEYLMFLDADDFFEPEMIRRAYMKCYKEDCDIVVFASDQFIERSQEFKHNHKTIKRALLPEKEPFTADEIKENVFSAFIGWPWDKMFRAEFVRENCLSFQEQRTTNDLLFVFSAVVRAKSICTIDDVFAHHRRLDDGESLSVSREKSWDCFYKALIALRNQLCEWDLYDRYERDFINYALHFSLWNLKTIKGKAYFDLYNKLKGEWLEVLGIGGKAAEYFYLEKDYRWYCSILENDAESFLFEMLKASRMEVNDIRKRFSSVKAELKQTKRDLGKAERELAKAKEKYAVVINSKPYKVGKKMAHVYKLFSK